MVELTFFEAALKVLAEAAGTPLHYREIAKRALAGNLIQTEGTTPDATFGAILYSHAKKARETGQPLQIEPLGKGVFALARATKNSIEQLVEESNERVLKRLLDALHEMDAEAFEQLAGTLLAATGFENVRVIGRAGDGGLDVLAELTVGGVTRVKTAVQVKRWKENVPGKIVRELRGALETDQRGLVITTSGFTRDAITEAAAANKSPISLLDGKRLVQLLSENQIGVRRQELRYLVLDIEQLEELSPEVSATTSEKYLALWPVPGGTRNFVESSRSMLEHVAKTNPTVKDMVEWMKGRFEKTQSDKTIRRYIVVLRTLGLVRYDGETVRLTPEGAEMLSHDSRAVAFRQLKANVAGVEEVLSELSRRALTMEEARVFLNRELGTKWETNAQTEYRLRWLENVGAIVKSDGKWKAAELRPFA